MGQHDMETKPLLGSSLTRPKWYKSKWFYLDLIRRCLAEFFGTALFVFVGVSSTRDTSTDPDHNFDTTPSSVTTVALGHGLAIMAMVASFGHISGGHFNPAVTCGAFIAGKINVLAALLYVFSQLAGSLCGSLLVLVLGPTYVQTGVHALSPGITPGMGIMVEMVLTSILVFTIISSAMDKASDFKQIASLNIGLTLSACIFAGFHTTGASLNPARSFGPAAVANDWLNHYVYWVGPALGSVLASVAYRFIFSHIPIIPLKRRDRVNDYFEAHT